MTPRRQQNYTTMTMTFNLLISCMLDSAQTQIGGHGEERTRTRIKKRRTSVRHLDHRLTYIYILDVVPPVYVVWNHVNTDKLNYHCKWRNVYVELSQTQ